MSCVSIQHNTISGLKILIWNIIFDIIFGNITQHSRCRSYFVPIAPGLCLLSFPRRALSPNPVFSHSLVPTLFFIHVTFYQMTFQVSTSVPAIPHITKYVEMYRFQTPLHLTNMRVKCVRKMLMSKPINTLRQRLFYIYTSTLLV